MKSFFDFKRFSVFLIFASFVFLVFYKLGDNYFSNWDEAWYADIGRNMVRTGNFLTPVFNQQPFFEKPPFYYWLSFLSFKIFGINEFAARFPSALAALGTGVLLFLLGQRLFNRHVAIVSVFILASTIGFLYRSRTGNLDSVLTLFIIATIHSFFMAFLKNNKMWYLVMGLSIALGFLTKGFIAFLFPILVVLYFILKRDIEIFNSKFLSGILIGITIPAVWIALNIILNGNDFISQFFHHQIEKFSGTLSFWENISFDFVVFLKSGLKYWFVLFIPLFLYSLYKWRNSKEILIPAYFMIYFGTLLLSRNKSNWFLMPLYPISALIISWGLFELGKRFKISSIFILLPVLCLGILNLIFYKHEYIVPDVVVDEVKVAKKANSLTSPKDRIYLTNYYYPTTIFYSDRKIIAVYGESENITSWIKHKKEWKNILHNKGIFIISTEAELSELKNNYPDKTFNIVYKSGDRLLIKTL